MDQNPATLNPRATLDAAGQRINALLFKGLTRIDADLHPQPDLSEGWEVLDSGKTWKFRIRERLTDHSGQAITPARIASCLEQYRDGKPISPLKGAFPNWIGTESDGRHVTFRLKHPDPYLNRNVSLLRYYTTGNPDEPCRELAGTSPVGSGRYKAERWDISPEHRLLIRPLAEPNNAPEIEFQFVHDENTKALKLVRGEIDVVQNALSLTKTRWLQKEYSGRFEVLERDGVTVSYLAFNLRDPILKQKPVRQAIALAIDRETIVNTKFQRFTKVAGSLLAPVLPESHSTRFEFDPRRAEKLLDDAGFPRRKGGARLTLRFKSTPVREGIENALILQDMLGRIGIRLVIDVVEPAVFFASIRKGAFQMFASRWLGVADGSILYNTLHTGHALNRVAYSDPEMDRLLEAAALEPKVQARLPLLRRVQEKMAEDLPYLPLWYWNTALITRKGITGLTANELSISGALEPLTRLR